MADESVEPHVVRLREDAPKWRRVDGPELTEPPIPQLEGVDLFGLVVVTANSDRGFDLRLTPIPGNFTVLHTISSQKGHVVTRQGNRR